jgi:hypothetical protein
VGIKYNPNDGTGRWYEYVSDETLDKVVVDLMEVIELINAAKQDDDRGERLGEIDFRLFDIWQEFPLM